MYIYRENVYRENMYVWCRPTLLLYTEAGDVSRGQVTGDPSTPVTVFATLVSSYYTSIICP